MRRAALIAWSLVCGYFLLVKVAVASDSTVSENVQLKVSVRQDVLKNNFSCTRTTTQVELLNMHSTDNIVIHSIETTPEETVLVRSSSADTTKKTWSDKEIPQQLHVHKLPSGSLTLSPGQVAIVPVTFYPRYPQAVSEHNNNRELRGTSPPPELSATARADLMQLVGEDILDHADHFQDASPIPHLTAPNSIQRKRNNIDPTRLPGEDEFEVSTTFIIETSRGVVTLPVSASSIRQNLYGLPDLIQFRHTEITVKPEDDSSPNLLVSPASHDSATTATSAGNLVSDGVVLINTLFESDVKDGPNNKENSDNNPTDRDCFDIYLSNPSQDNELDVARILVSRPEVMSVEFDPSKLLFTPDIVLKPSGPSHIIRKFTEDGPMSLPIDSEDNYVGTVCTRRGYDVPTHSTPSVNLDAMSHAFDLSTSELSLGIVQILTSSEPLYINLEWDKPRSLSVTSLPESSDSTDSPTSISTTTPTNDTSTSPPQTTTSSTTTTTTATTTTATTSPQTPNPNSSALLKAVPDRVDFHVTSSAAPASVVRIGMQNKSPVPIRIMRVTIGMDTTADDNQVDMAKKIGLKMNVGIGDNGMANVNNGNGSGNPLMAFILPAASTVDEALVLSCSVKWDLMNFSQDAFKFTGTMVLRGTMDTELNYTEWRDEMLRDPYRDSHLILEVPYSISVVNGRIEVFIERSNHPYSQLWSKQPWDNSGRAVSALFFPLFPIDVYDNPEDKEPTLRFRGSGSIVHDLRVMSSMALSLRLVGAEIETAASTLEGENSLCQRFNASLIPQHPSSSDHKGYEEVGLVSLRYSFRDPPRSSSSSPSSKSRGTGHTLEGKDYTYPTTCYLNLITDPLSTGLHRLPILVFSGQVDIAIPNVHTESSLGNSQEHENDHNSLTADTCSSTTASMGLRRLLSWFQTSVAGNALRTILRDSMNNFDLQINDELLLSRYMSSLCKDAYTAGSLNFRPILLKAGAIEHGEVVRTPLYITNHNPVPITVSTVVGEVEGMSLTLGRDASRARGDGNNLLDYIRQPPPPPTIVHNARHGKSENILAKRGKYQGHPLNGLRQFLLSNEAATSFSLQFPFRDALSPSSAAMAREPLLKPLYKRFSYVEFHRTAIPIRQHHHVGSVCDETYHPPLYHPFNSTNEKKRPLQAIPGPLLVSGDQMINRPLSVCWDVSHMDDSAISKVMIPPGGVTRFDIRVRAPPYSVLDSDISQLIATGLVLSTNYGEALPIFASFEALQGQLHVSHEATLRYDTATPSLLTSSDDGSNVRVISVSMDLSWEKSFPRKNLTASTTLTIPPSSNSSHTIRDKEAFSLVQDTDSHNNSRREVSLYLRSSFSREVRLLNVESCNPWFAITLHNAEHDLKMDVERGVNIGTIHGKMSCGPSNGSLEPYPSFYRCALNWLSNRSNLQPRGCGLLPAIKSHLSKDDNMLDVNHGGEDRAISAIERALQVLKIAYGPSSGTNPKDFVPSFEVDKIGTQKAFGSISSTIKSGAQRHDGYIAPLVLDAFAETWDAWRLAEEYGLRDLSSNLRATIEYDTFSGNSQLQSKSTGSHSLALSMNDLAIESSISAPSLFDYDAALSVGFDATPPDDEYPAIIEFLPTLVATVVPLMIPLKNPTSVPVRVRLGVAPALSTIESCSDCNSDKFLSDSKVRMRYLQDWGTPYVQNGQPDSVPNENAQHLWWDGGGAFFLSDDKGDVVRSHHNITIRAGAGAHVSLVNPSLHANVAFLVGCGLRCGIRDDPQVTGAPDMSLDPKLTSPLGASSAAGISLLGHQHKDTNLMGKDEPNILAGGSPLPKSGGPAAFAIPYSALDEIIIPPHSAGKIGPVFFRPPGRFGILGCELAAESKINHWGVNTAKNCDSQKFESMIFLENSLTGLERVILRGKALWERVYFLDPQLPEDEDEKFGDIEFRNGRPTLIFSGSAVSIVGSPYAQPDIKEVVLHNGGDIPVDIARTFLTDTSQLPGKNWGSTKNRKNNNACVFGNFQIMNCYESDEATIHFGGEVVENIRAGFHLEPGQNRSIFIQHSADCTNNVDFVSLNVEIQRADMPFLDALKTDDKLLSLSRSGEVRNSKANNWRRTFRKRKIELLLGYEMNEESFSSCVPVDYRSTKLRHVDSAISLSQQYAVEFLSRTSMHKSISSRMFASSMQAIGRNLFEIVIVLFVVLVAVTLVARPLFIRHLSSEKFETSIRDVHTHSPDNKSILHFNRWALAFRYICRIDPSCSELQLYGKEQMRQVMLGSYRSRGLAAPQSLNNSSAFTRERSGVISGSGSRQRSSKDGSVGNDRIRTLSDSIFHDSISKHISTSDKLHLPAGLGWRTAYTRGVFNASSSGPLFANLKSSALIRKRNGQTMPEPSLSNKNTPQRNTVVDENASVQSNSSSKGRGSKSSSRNVPVSNVTAVTTRKTIPETHHKDKDLPKVAENEVVNGSANTKKVSNVSTKTVPPKTADSKKSNGRTDANDRKTQQTSDRKRSSAVESSSGTVTTKSPPPPPPPVVAAAAAAAAAAASGVTTKGVGGTGGSNITPATATSAATSSSITSNTSSPTTSAASGATNATSTTTSTGTTPASTNNKNNNNNKKYNNQKETIDSKNSGAGRGSRGRNNRDKGKSPVPNTGRKQHQRNTQNTPPNDSDTSRSTSTTTTNNNNNTITMENEPPARKGKQKADRNNTSSSGQSATSPSASSKSTTVPPPAPKQGDKPRQGGKNNRGKGKKGNTKKNPSPARSPSSQSMSSATDDIAVITAPDQTPLIPTLRPPPGLAPPPGFTREDQGAGALAMPAANEHSSSLLLPTSASSTILGQPSLGPMLDSVLSNPDLTLGSATATTTTSAVTASVFPSELPLGTNEPNMLFSSTNINSGMSDLPPPGLPNPDLDLSLTTPVVGLGAATATASSQLPTLGQGGFVSPAPPTLEHTITPLLNDNTNEGFDVMDFLDSILSDGNASSSEPETPGALLPIPSNPWASQGSRAAAYGISFDDAEVDNASEASAAMDDPSSSGVVIPLLTPAALIPTTHEEKENNYDDNNQVTGSLYANLMEEQNE